MRAAIPQGIRPLSAVRFDFMSDSDRMGLPFVYVDGVQIDIFALPVYVCDDDELYHRSSAFGIELARIVLAWIRKWHIREDTRDLDPVIELPSSPDLAQFVRMLGAYGGRGSWQHGCYDSFFSVLEDALNHAVTARGDSERDGMIPADFDQLTPELAESRLRKVLAGERVSELGYRVSAPV
ncbi:MAG: hypothetical protein ACK5D9_02815 [Burkholderiales bacterium]|jgi:hypothetical protein